MSYRSEIIIDPKFKSGFFLQGPNPVTDQRINFTYLDYDGKAIVPSRKVWIMTQWWTPFPFSDSKFEDTEMYYRYSNESRSCKINKEDGEITIYLNSYLEYEKRLGHSRDKAIQPWSHFLFEQDFYHPLSFRKLQAFIARLDFCIDKVNQLDEAHYNPEIHAAQLLWYLTIKEVKKNTAVDDSNPLKDNYIWIGIPIFDNRYKTIKGSQVIDKGFSGATNSLIYTISSSAYLKEEPIQLGKYYSIDVDLLPYIKKSVRYAIRQGIFSSERNLFVNYMNIGWEVPGSFEVESRLKNIHLEAISDE